MWKANRCFAQDVLESRGLEGFRKQIYEGRKGKSVGVKC